MCQQAKTKLLFVIYGLGIGGAERSLVNLLNEIDYDRYEVDLYVMDYFHKSTQNGLLSQINEKVNFILPDRNMRFLTAINIKTLLKFFSFKRAFYWFKSKLLSRKAPNQYTKNQMQWSIAYKPIIKKLEKEYDCAIGFMHSLPSYYVIDKTLAKKKYLWIHNDYNKMILGKEYDRNYFEKANKVVTISESCKEILEQAFPDLENKFECTYNLTPINKIIEKSNLFYPEQYKCESLKLLSIGRLTYQKGFDVAIKTAQALYNDGIEFKWIVLGEGELRAELESQISDEIKDKIMFIGSVLNPYPYLLNCDILIQSSRFEGKSIVLDEAKILCKPVICTNYATAKDQIKDGFNGIIVPMEDAQTLKNEIINLSKNKELRNKIIENLKGEKFVTIDDYEVYFNGEK